MADTITFKNDVTITVHNTNFDGADVVVSNCVLTVDGLHTFASLQILNGGKLTHTPGTNGLAAGSFNVTEEPQQLSGTNAHTLFYPSVNLTNIVVNDVTGQIVYTNGVDYLVAVDNNYATIQRTDTSVIPDGATVLVSYQVVDSPVVTGLNLTVSGDVLVDTGSTIDVDGRGFGGTSGIGHGYSAGSPASGSGGSHGGYGGPSAGGTNVGTRYDVSQQPTDKGSPGGSGYEGLGGFGGGAINLVIGGVLHVNGTVTANGANGITSRSGGGSGGSIWLSVQTIDGNGAIGADGGSGEPSHGGGGGGGMIALYYGINDFSGKISSRGGKGFIAGGAGTIYSKGTNQSMGLLLVDNGGRSGANTLITQTGSFDLTVTNGGVVSINNSISVRDLLIASNGFFNVGGLTTQPISVTRNATVQDGGGILADSGGYGGGLGQGAGRFISNPVYMGSGASHGGFGSGGRPNTPVAQTYDSIAQPTTAGSGGGVNILSSVNGAGGGIVRMIVIGDLKVDGRISADGGSAMNQGGGGGSGGSIWLTAGSLTGSGTISANGGAGNDLGGGGGGGRIAVYLQTNSFGGTIKAWGGNGVSAAGPGTIYISVVGNVPAQLLVDNGGQMSTNATPISISSDVNWTVSGGAIVAPSTSQSINDLLVRNNGWLVITNYQSSYSWTVTGSATIEQGGGILADGAGYPGGQGTGFGKLFTGSQIAVGGGGGYGGYGASVTNSSGTDLGGTPYGSVAQPIDRGSGGGGGAVTSPTVGGAGGGALRLSITGLLRMDGKLSADGMPGISSNGGGGSGGSLWLTVGGLSGAGTISANGGLGTGVGGAGAGGRIALYYKSNSFAGSIQARGAGSGTNYAGAGTIYSQLNNQPPQVSMDNGGAAGRITTFGTGGISSLYDLSLGGGATMTATILPNLRNLLVASNASLVLTNGGSGASLNVFSATIQAGGGISVDGMGYSANLGPGVGKITSTPVASGGGGGFGGAGAPSSILASGGNSYSLTSVVQPAERGSGGGVYPSSGGPGSAGGGALYLTVTDALVVDGRISADGNNGYTQGSGGGSGGSLWIITGKLSGSGVISASGGMGNGIGGGGGGGRIALYYNTNTFTGSVRALGALGGNGYGGAGTIYTKPGQGNGQLVINNNGNSGQITGLGNASFPMDVIIQDGGIFYPNSASYIHSLQVSTNGRVVITNVQFSLTGDLTIEAGGSMVADAMGSFTGQGLGSGQKSGIGGGGGHGGFGGSGYAGAINGAVGGLAYDSVTQPSSVGSGGGPGSGNAPTNSGGPGGGCIRITTPGNLRIDGRLSAEGGAGIGEGSGGGSGGSIWLDARTISGTGIISANGGAGNGTGPGAGGGGGGGRIALYYTSNNFSGTISAYGGSGASFGGAGTIYRKQAGPGVGGVVVDNGGGFGTNTPVTFSVSTPFDLTVRNGALVYPTNGYFIVSNLVVGAGGTIASLNNQTNLDIEVLGNATIQTGGAIEVDGLGYHVAGGPGVGFSHVLGIGSGGGYGGKGGASSLTPGGRTYGSAQQPLDRGSGGGFGWQSSTNGGAGGGAIRLNVLGTFTVDGRIGADGTTSQQDDGGGGSGGSVWVNASAITGSGFITAEGGDGELYEGGGGGGGRVAIYSPSNSFAGIVSTAGGDGFFPGETGSIYYATNLPALVVLSQTPSGIVSNGVYTVDLFFNTPLNPSISISNISLSTPNGVLTRDALAVFVPGISQLRISFDRQTAVGDYAINIGTDVMDMYGQSMSQDYTGTFKIALPVIQGTITDTKGQPVAGILLQASGGLASTMTDSNGNYLLELVPGYTGTVTPVKTGTFFVPSSMNYSNFVGSVSNQNYAAFSAVAPSVAGGLQDTSNVLSWYGISQVNYQAQYSSNLVDWVSYGNVMTGSNALLQLQVPIDTNGAGFFRLQATY